VLVLRRSDPTHVLGCAAVVPAREGSCLRFLRGEIRFLASMFQQGQEHSNAIWFGGQCQECSSHATSYTSDDVFLVLRSISGACGLQIKCRVVSISEKLRF
jgi:hypothetical protein